MINSLFVDFRVILRGTYQRKPGLRLPSLDATVVRTPRSGSVSLGEDDIVSRYGDVSQTLAH